ncbi:MAG: SDR family oxidoreductase [Candidatus Eremiobacterota bacterium]
MNPVTLITGASRGLGLETARILARRGTPLILVARGESALRRVQHELSKWTEVLAIPADVSQDAERVAALARQFGQVDVLINNASILGPTPMPALADYPWFELEKVLRVNVLAPLHLTQLLLPRLTVNLTSDAGVEAYPGWGGYGMSKAALEHQTRTLAAELGDRGHRFLLVDPSDMNTEMHRQAEPGADLSHLPGPELLAPSLVELLDRNDSAPFRRVRLEVSHVGAL